MSYVRTNYQTYFEKMLLIKAVRDKNFDVIYEYLNYLRYRGLRNGRLLIELQDPTERRRADRLSRSFNEGSAFLKQLLETLK